MRCGLVGLGHWGKNLYRELGARLVAVCELDTKVWPTYQRPGLRFTTDLHELLDLCDAVYVATPIGTHYGVARAALEAKKHVWVEKPFCTDSKLAEELVKLAQAQGVRLFVGHIMNYHGSFLKVLEWLRQNPGEPILQFISERGKVIPNNQRHPGDLLFDLAPHDLSIMRRLLSGQEVGVHIQGCPQTHVTAHFVFSSEQQAFMTWSRTFVQKKASYTLVTPNFMLLFDDTKSDTSEKLLIQHRSTGYQHFGEPPEECTSPLQNEIQAFLDPAEPYTTGEEGLEVVKLLEVLKQNL